MNNFLDRLDVVRDKGDGQYMCRCPGPMHSNADRNPSLSVKITPDGTTLLHCFSGCTPLEVCHAVGLELKDLYPDGGQASAGKMRQRINPRDVLNSIEHEVLVVWVAAQRTLGGELTEGDLERLTDAARRIGKAREVISNV